MINRFFIFFFLVCFATAAYCQQSNKEQQVLLSAGLKNHPVIAIFLGEKSCPWSQKLESEVLSNPQFLEKISKETLLWQVSLEGKEGDRLREKYHIQVSPSILLLDPLGKEFARLEYVPLDAFGYAAQINELIENFQELCLVLEQKAPFEEEKWQSLYHKAKKCSVSYFKQIILEQGLQLGEGNFFHVEKYAIMLEKHKRKHPQVVKFKKQLLEE